MIMRLWLLAVLGFLLAGCVPEPGQGPPPFPTAEQAIAHWRSHEGEFRQMAEDWRRSGGEKFYSYPDFWWWNGTEASKTWWGFGPWQVTRTVGVTGSEEATFWSADDAARFAAAPASMLASLRGHAQLLHLTSLAEVVAPTGLPCTRSELEGGLGYPRSGFLHCPGSSVELKLEQVHGSWLMPDSVEEPASAYQVINEEWAYFAMTTKSSWE
jgi:hypothetical protein